MKCTEEFFNDYVLIIREKKQLEKIMLDFNISNKGNLNNFPMIVFKNVNHISISGIEENNLIKLKNKRLATKEIVEFLE